MRSESRWNRKPRGGGPPGLLQGLCLHPGCDEKLREVPADHAASRQDSRTRSCAPLLPSLRGSHSPDSGGAEGGRGAGGDVRVVLGIKFVFNSVLERRETALKRADGTKVRRFQGQVT